MDELEAILETGGAAAVEIAASALAERGGKVGHCANCGNPVIGPYCAVCGQPINTHRRKLGRLLHDFIKDVVNFDSRILRTARALLFQPGELPRAFHDGRTQRYMPAVRLYLFSSLLFFLLLSVTGIAIVQFEIVSTPFRLVADKSGNVVRIVDGVSTPLKGFKADAQGKLHLVEKDAPDIELSELKADGSQHFDISSHARFFQRIGSIHTNLNPKVKAKIDELGTAATAQPKGSRSGWMLTNLYHSLQELENDPAALNKPLTTWIPRVLFLLLPLFAILLAVFYLGLRKEFYFVDHLIFSLSLHSFGFVVLIAATVAAQFTSEAWVGTAAVGAVALYMLLSLKWFYREGWIRTGLKFVGIGFIYTVFLVIPALAGAVAASLLGA